MLKFDQLEEGEGLVFVPKDLKHNRHQGGGGQINYDDDEYDDDDDDDDCDDDNDDYDVFSSSQRTSNMVGTRGSR